MLWEGEERLDKRKVAQTPPTVVPGGYLAAPGVLYQREDLSFTIQMDQFRA
jgi:hypothetical protein